MGTDEASRERRGAVRRRKKEGAALLTAAVLLIVGTCDVLAAVRSYSMETENHIFTGDVAISLEEYELDENGAEVPYRDGKQVVPGQTVDKIVKITNEAEPVWIRAEALCRGAESTFEEMAGGISEKWVRRGKYYYYTEPAASEEAICFFRTITIPAEWDEHEEGQTFYVEITAQAVQAANFTPDFSQEDPWFGIPVEACIHDRRRLSEGEEQEEYTVIFENGSEGFVKTGEDFFSNFRELMPGDRVKDSVEVGSRYSGKVDIWFRTDQLEQTEEEKQLLQQLRLTVRNGEKQIYDGPLSGGDLESGILLAQGLGRGESRCLSYEIHMPEELNNFYAVRETGVKWIFRAEYRSSSGGGNSGGGGSGGRSAAPAPGKEPETVYETVKQIVEGTLPKLGDTSHVQLWIVLAGTGTALFMISVRRKR